PAALKLLAFQGELQLSRLVGFAWVVPGHPAAAIPDDDLSCTVFTFGNLAFKLIVGQWVIFHLHRHAFDSGVQTGALGHGPAFHGAIQLQPQVVMQPAGPMLLYDEGREAVPGSTVFAGLRCKRKVTLGPVRFKWIR